MVFSLINNNKEAGPGNISMRHRVFLIAGLLVVVSLLLLAISYVQADIMNSVRSYVRGEGLWAKAQKDAVFHLKNFAYSGDESEYALYQESLQIPLNDREARLILQSGFLDREKVSMHFIKGQNHEADVDGMIRFFLMFENFPYMSDAIDVWSRADKLIMELQQEGEKIRYARKHPEVVAASLAELDTLNRQLSELEYQFSLVLSEGALWVKSVLTIAGFSIFIVMLIIVSIISRKIIRGIEKTEQSLLVSEDRFSSLYYSGMLGIVDWHQDGRIVDANDAFLDMLGYEYSDLQRGKFGWQDLITGDARNGLDTAMNEIQSKGVCTPFEKDIIDKNGNVINAYLGAALLNGEKDRGICFVVDQTRQKQAQTQLQLSAIVFDASNDGIIITDKHMNIIKVNKAYCAMKGCSQSDVLGRYSSILRLGFSSEEYYWSMWKKLNETGSWEDDVSDTNQDGAILPVHLSVNAVKNDKGEIEHYVLILTDISARKAAEENLRNIANHDHLTGLPNRMYFNDLLTKSIQRANRQDELFALLFIDLDRFKPVNDEYGHEVGDMLLQSVAKRLKKSVREADIVSRLGGDEFVVLMENVKSKDDAATVAEKLIANINSPFILGTHSISIGASVGISLYPHDGNDSKALLKNADTAMYEAKSAGRNEYFYFNNAKQA